MKLHQLSVFLENQPGRLSKPCETLSEAGVNIRALSLADTREFGILRLLVADWEKAKAALEAKGSVVNITEVVAIEVSDRPGGLAGILKTLEAAEVSVEYMYAFTERVGADAVMIMRLGEMDKGIAALQQKGVNVLKGIDLLRES